MGKNVKIERFLKIPIGPIVKIVNSLDDPLGKKGGKYFCKC